MLQLKTSTATTKYNNKYNNNNKNRGQTIQMSSAELQIKKELNFPSVVCGRSKAGEVGREVEEWVEKDCCSVRVRSNTPSLLCCVSIHWGKLISCCLEK